MASPSKKDTGMREDSPTAAQRTMEMSRDVAVPHSTSKTPSKTPGKTPSKSRVSLGVPSSYYFKYMNSSKKKKESSFLESEDEGDHTGTISIPGDKSTTEADTSLISLGVSTTSSSNSEESDLLNKSTLSDTTELTASNFVLAATSRQRLRQLAMTEKESSKKPSVSTTSPRTREDLLKPDSPIKKDEVVDVEETEVASVAHAKLPAKASVAKNPAVSRSPPLDQVGTNAKVAASEETPKLSMAATPNQTLKEASPSIRSRISASPKSLRKFTESLKNSRIKRQMQREEDAKRRLSTDSSVFSLNSPLNLFNNQGTNRAKETARVERNLLPPPFTQLTQESAASSTTLTSPGEGSTTQEILGAMEEIFGSSQESSVSKKRSSITARKSSVDRLLEESNSGTPKLPKLSDIQKASPQELSREESSPRVQDNQEEDHPESSTTDAVPTSIDISQGTSLTPPREETAGVESPLSSRERPTPAGRLTPGPTPTKLAPTPRRLPNPRALDSPARNTRSSAKKRVASEEAQSPPQVLLDFDMISETASAKSPTTPSEDPEASTETSTLGDLSGILGRAENHSVSSPSMDGKDDDSLRGDSDVVKPVEQSQRDGDDGSTAFQSGTPSSRKSEEPVEDTPNSSMAKSDGDTASVGDLSFIFGGHASGSVAESEGVQSELESSGISDTDKVIGNTSTESVVGGSVERSDCSVHKQTSNNSGTMSNNAETNGEGTSTPTLERGGTRNENSPAMVQTRPLENCSGKEHQSETVNEVRLSESPTHLQDSVVGMPHVSDDGTSSPPESTTKESPTRCVVQTPPPLESSQESTQESFGSSRSDSFSNRGPSDTASLGDIADLGDILGTQSQSPASSLSHRKRNSENSTPRSDKRSRSESAGESAEKLSLSGTNEETEEVVASFLHAQSKKSPMGVVRSPMSPKQKTPPKTPDLATKSPMRLAPNSHVKPTPTKITRSPRRIVNPQLVNSPARNTRSARKAALEALTPEVTEGDSDSAALKRPFDDVNSDAEKDDVVPEDEELNFGGHKRQRPSMGSRFGSADASGKENLSPKTPTQKKQTRVGILSSTKRGSKLSGFRSNQKFVAFGSPEAAEYRIGSPSVSLTPMPSHKAKELFSIPRENLSGESTDTSNDGHENTVEIEDNLNVLVDRMTVDNMKDSPALSPIDSTREDTGPVILPGDYSLRSSFDRSRSSTRGNNSVSFAPREDVTVELEAGMDGLIGNAMASPQVSGNEQESNVSGPVFLPGNYSVLSTSKSRLSLSDSVSIGNISNNEKTVELEAGIDGLLANALATPKSTEPGQKNQEADSSSRRSSVVQDQSVVSRAGDSIDATSMDLSTGVGDGSKLSPAESSVDMTDARSIASVNSAHSEKFTANVNLGAQKLDFSFDHTTELASLASKGDSMDVDEGNTVELECDMTTLLAAAGVRDGLAKTGSNDNPDDSVEDTTGRIDATGTGDGTLAAPADMAAGVTADVEMTEVLGSPTGEEEVSTRDSMDAGGPIGIALDDSSVISKRSRRSSIASRRFTLSRSDGLSPEEESFVEGRSVSFAQTTESIEVDTKYVQPLQETVTLTIDELATAAGTSRSKLGLRKDTEAGDSMVSFNSSTASSGKFASERWRQFLEAVCGEVEKRIEADGSAAEALSLAFGDDVRRYGILQRNVLSEENERVKSNLRQLVATGRVAIGAEWNTWLATVLESFQSPIMELSKTLDSEASQVDESSRMLSDLQNGLSIVNNRKTQRARRKSLVRRKSAVSDLEEEIRRLQGEIAEHKASLRSLHEDEARSRDKLHSVEETKGRLDGLNSMQPVARKSQRVFLSLKGLNSWSPVSVGETRMLFESNGCNRQTSTSLSYEIVQTGSREHIKVSTKERSHGMVCSEGRHGGAVTEFMVAMADQASASVPRRLDSMSQVGDHLQKFGWAMGRIDQTAAELHCILRRYKARIVRDGMSDFVLNVDFEGSASKLTVDFNLDKSYPSLPLEVRLDLLEGTIDFEVIRKALVKNAAPGFGYLSRACDIIRAFVK